MSLEGGELVIISRTVNIIGFLVLLSDARGRNEGEKIFGGDYFALVKGVFWLLAVGKYN